MTIPGPAVAATSPFTFTKIKHRFSTVTGMKAFGMCLNWKVLLSLAVVALGLYFAVSPRTFSAALPLLLAAACPLSMVLMMRSRSHGSHAAPPQPASPPVPVLTTKASEQA
jgi:hypothetical protein